jgi:hypothetical protein
LSIVEGFGVSGICLLAGDGMISCVGQPEMAKRLRSPPPPLLFEIAQDLASESDDPDGGKVEAFIEECADLLYNLKTHDVNSSRTPSLILSPCHVIWRGSIVPMVHANLRNFTMRVHSERITWE